MKSPRPVRQHKGGPSNSLHYARGNAGKGTRVRAATSSSYEADDPTDRFLAELYPTLPAGPSLASSRHRLPTAHKREERTVRADSPCSPSKVLICSKRSTVFSGPAFTRDANAGPSNSAAFMYRLGEAHARSSHVETQLGMHVLRCLELVGELGSEAHSRMHIHISDNPNLDFAKVDRAIQDAAVGNTHNKTLGTVCGDCDGQCAGEPSQGVKTAQGGGGAVRGARIVQGVGRDVQGER